jgi:penicillin amidase
VFLDDVRGDRRLLGRVGGNVASLIAGEPGARWFDNINTPPKETRDDVLVKIVEEAVVALTKQFGPDQSAWRWERANTIDIPYQLPIGSGLEPLSDTRKLGPFAKERRAGWTVNPVGGNAYRMLVDFADLDGTQTQLAPGNSGVPASPHFSDQTQMWVAGEYKLKPHSRNKVVGAAASHTTLTP